jgi:hypothetical protein
VPRYYFNVYDGRDILDDLGAELPDCTFARREAIRYSGALLEDQAKKLALGEDWRMEVTDSTGLILFVLNFTVLASAAVPQAAVIPADR